LEASHWHSAITSPGGRGHPWPCIIVHPARCLEQAISPRSSAGSIHRWGLASAPKNPRHACNPIQQSRQTQSVRARQLFPSLPSSLKLYDNGCPCHRPKQNAQPSKLLDLSMWSRSQSETLIPAAAERELTLAMGGHIREGTRRSVSPLAADARVNELSEQPSSKKFAQIVEE